MGIFWEVRITRMKGTRVRSKTLATGYHDNYDTALADAKRELEQWGDSGRLSIWLSCEDWGKLQ